MFKKNNKSRAPDLDKYIKKSKRHRYVSTIMKHREINEGKGYIPTYKNSSIITDLLELFDMNALGKEIIFHDNMKKIFKNICKGPDMIKKRKTRKSN